MRGLIIAVLLGANLIGCDSLSSNNGTGQATQQSDLLAGRWASGDSGGVAMLSTGSDLRCELSVWNYVEESQITSDRCLASPGDSRLWANAQMESVGWRFQEVYYLTVEIKNEKHLLKAAIYKHPYEGSVMTISEDGEEFVGDFWTRVRSPRGMLAAGIGLSPELSKAQRACVIEGVEAEASDDVLDVIFEIYPDRFNFDWQAHWDALAFTEYLSEECGVDGSLVDMIDEGMY